MGLDMYLTAKRRWCNFDKDMKKTGIKIKKLFPEMFDAENLGSLGVEFEAGYWRKANHIHSWFVENCQDGVDECQHTYIIREQLVKLLRLCERVLNNKKLAEKLLPTTSGCFFGGSEYDEYYFIDIEATIKITKKCLELPENWSFEYHSSW